MTIEVTVPRMNILSKCDGRISIEGDIGEQEIVVRFQMSQADASDMYYELASTESPSVPRGTRQVVNRAEYPEGMDSA